MVDAARRLCQRSNRREESCFHYHRLWPYLRRIGYRGSAWRHAAHYVNSYRAVARGGGSRVLISGCADCSMLAHVVHAFRAEGVEPEVTVLDVCEAPLFINKQVVHHARQP